MQTPSIGRIVHFYAGTASPPAAAIITAVHESLVVSKRWPSLIGDGVVSMTVFASDAPVRNVEPVTYSETDHGGRRWCYPPRV